jgi:integrase
VEDGDQLRDPTALAGELLILTATRTSEGIGARWAEFDLEGGKWTIPAERIKAAKQHQIPLSEPALALFQRLRELRQSLRF